MPQPAILVLSLLVSITFIVLGFVYAFIHYPKKINPISGYKTAMASKNQDTWEEAQKYSGRCMFFIGILCLAFSIICCLLFSGYFPVFLSNAVTLAAMFLVIPIVEIHLRRMFNKDGSKKNGVLMKTAENATRYTKEIKMSGFEKVIQIICTVMLGGIIISIIVIWPSLPSRILVHFDLLGKADAYGNKNMLLILLTFDVFIYAVMSAFEIIQSARYSKKIEVSNFNWHKFKDFLVVLKLESIATIEYIMAVMIISVKHAANLGAWFLPCVIILMIATIAFFVKKKILS